MLVLGTSVVFLIACNLPGLARDANEEATLGKALYEQNCASCHGIDGEGQPDWRVPDANGVYPAPPHTSDGHTWHHPDQQLLAIIADGGMMSNSSMPGFGEQLSAEEMEAILAYIKTFWDEDDRKYQEQVTDQYLGSTE